MAHDVPQRLRCAIQLAGLTHEAVADKSGVTRSAVSQWLSGAADPKLENLVLAVAACGMTMEQFFALRLDEQAAAG